MDKLVNFEDSLCTPQTLKGCLDYLYRQAMIAGLRLPAHFIGAAAEATSDIIERGEAGSKSPAEGEARPAARRAIGDR